MVDLVEVFVVCDVLGYSRCFINLLVESFLAEERWISHIFVVLLAPQILDFLLQLQFVSMSLVQCILRIFQLLLQMLLNLILLLHLLIAQLQQLPLQVVLKVKILSFQRIIFIYQIDIVSYQFFFVVFQCFDLHFHVTIWISHFVVKASLLDDVLQTFNFDVFQLKVSLHLLDFLL